MFLPSSFFFLLVMVVGVFFSLSSSNWFLVWCGLEMNLMGFIPIIIQFKNLGEIESAVKYFLVQSLGSAFVLFGSFVIYYDMFSLSGLGSVSGIFILMGLMLKLGVFPFYFWLPSVMMGMDWLSCFLIATWQKVAPLSLIMTSFCDMTSVLVMVGVLSSLVGGFMGMNQVNLKSLIAYSSIGHMGWMLSVCQFSLSVGLTYLFLYVVTNMLLFFCLFKLNFVWLESLKGAPYLMQYYVLLLGFGFLTISGIPPLLGFFPKFFSVEILMSSGMILATFGLILGTCFSLYYYMNLVLNCSSAISNWKGSFLTHLGLKWDFLALLILNLLFVLSFVFLMYAVIVFYKS